MRKLYFAHGRMDYNTEREKDMLKKISFVFSGCKVINPGATKFQKWIEPQVDRFQSANEYMAPFFKIISECNSLVFMSLETENMGVGTYLETRHAEVCGIPVYTWDGMRFTTAYKLIEIHCHGGKKDYKDFWAKVIIK